MRQWSVRFASFLVLTFVVGVVCKVVNINQEYAANAWSIPHPDPRASRPIYPYSVVAGGIYSVEELFNAVQKDPVVRKHYQEMVKEAVFRQTLDHDILAHVSYRIGNQVLWTKQPVTVKAGEQILTDGHSIIRSRCGNLVSAARVLPNPHIPPETPVEPPVIVLDTQLPPLIPPPSRVPSLLTAKLPPPEIAGPAHPPIPPNPPTTAVLPPIWPERHDPPSPPVPEPSVLLLIGTGLTALGVYVRKKRQP